MKKTREEKKKFNKEVEGLVLKAQSGDKIAEEKIIKKFEGLISLVSSKYYLIYPGNEDGEKDLKQEGRIALCDAIKKFDAAKGILFETYASTCIENRIINAVKKEETKKNSLLNNAISIDKEDDEGNPIRDEIAAPRSALDEGLYAKEIIEYMGSEKSELSSFERQVWVLIIQDKTSKEIAVELGKSQKSIDNAIQRIRKKLTKIHTQE